MTKAELDLVKARIVAMARGRRRRKPASTVEYQVGTMIELPRAALRAGEIAEAAEFFSFGTNDLTQTTLGISRDDAASLPRHVHAEGHPRADPFVTIDSGRRRRTDQDRGRARAEGPAGHQARHLRRAWRRSGLDPFLREAGLDYVSCSPYRVPIARLAAAQAALGRKAASQA